MQIKLPNWDNFDDHLIPRLIQDYRVLKKPTDFFFSYEGAVVKFSDVDTLLKNQLTNQNIWLYLLIYLLNLSYAQHHHRPFIRFIIIQDSKPIEQKQAIAFQELTDLLNQDTSIEYDRHIMLIKLRSKYFGVINQHSKTYLLNYSNLKEQDITYILEQTALFELQELIVVNKYIKDDSSHLLFKHMGQSILGQKLESISLSEYDSEKCMRRLVWTVIQTGFNEIDRLFQLNLQQEDEDKQQQIIQYQQDKLKEQITKGRGKAFEDKTDRIRLKTPVTQEEYEKQMQYLNERISHLKMLNGDGNSNDVLMSQMFQIRNRDLESKIDQEFHNLDNLKQQQLTFKNSSLPFLRNASEILKGNFHEGLFKGLGLDLKPQNLSREQVLNYVKEHNFNTIQKPLLEYNNDKQVIPGVFIKANVNRILAYRYDIQVCNYSTKDFQRYVKQFPDWKNMQ